MIKFVSAEINQILIFLAYRIRAESIEENKIVFKFGERSDNFYLTLKGYVSVLTPREVIVSATEQEYYDYLMRLRQYEEFELITMVLLQNSKVYPIKDNEFDKWLRNSETTTLTETFKKSFIIEKDFYKFRRKIDYKSVTFSDYIDRTKIKISNFDYYRKQITVFNYFFILDLGEKSKFGDLGLNSQDQKR